MNIFLNNFFSNLPVTRANLYKNRAAIAFCGKQEEDTFTKGSNSDKGPEQLVEGAKPVLSVRKKRSRKATKKGEDLKQLDNITCPYSGIKLISCRRWDSEIKPKLENAKTFDDKMAILETYEPNMQKLEKQVFKMFKDYQKKNPGTGSFNDCLQQARPKSLIKLRNDEFRVLNEIDSLSQQVGDDQLLYDINILTTNARVKILQDRRDNIFRRKDIVNPLKDLKKNCKDKKLAEDLWEKANELPKAKTNIDAFVVKYAYRNPEAIAERLLYPSLSSIEHIRPAWPEQLDLEQGEDDMTNFMLAANDWNSGRGGQALPKFIVKHPDIPEHSQEHINDIIKAIHNKELKGYDWYPYVLKAKLFNESDGLIDVNIDNYNMTEKEAFKYASPKVKRKYADLRAENKKITPKTVEEYKSANGLS